MPLEQLFWKVLLQLTKACCLFISMHATLLPSNGGNMSATVKSLPNLTEAIQNANQILSKSGYTVKVANEQVTPKEPVFLQLKLPNGKFRNIGITYLVHLTGNDWDKQPFEAMARTTDQVTQSIIDRVALFFKAKEQKLYIDKNGTIFNFNSANVKLYKDKTFAVDDVHVFFVGSPLLLTRIKSEGMIKFIKLDNGHTQLFDTIDRRRGKGIFIDTNGELYRA
jgi:hypothetical protein